MTNEERAHELAMFAAKAMTPSGVREEGAAKTAAAYNEAFKAVLEVGKGEPLPKLEAAKVELADLTDYQLDGMSKQLALDDVAIRAEYNRRSKQKRELVHAYAQKVGYAWLG